MNWSAVKNLLIAILVAANAFLVFNIIRQDRTRGYIEYEEAEGAAELLSERGLIVDADTVPLLKFKAPVYESIYNDEYYTEVAEMISGTEREMLLSLPDGGFSVTAKNGATVEFDTEFGFAYFKDDKSSLGAYTDITVSHFKDTSGLSGAKLKKLSEAAKAFLDSGSSDYSLRAKITGGVDDPESGITYLLAMQELGGHEVYSHYAVCGFKDEELVCAYGRWYFAPLSDSYNTELVDQINILFYDLAVLRQSAAAPFLIGADSAAAMVPSVVSNLTDGDSTAAIPVEEGRPVTVVSLGACYATYWSADKSAVYFIPAWQIAHDNGRITVFNATNGTVYSNNI